MTICFIFKTGLESLQEEAGENLPEDIADNDSEEDDDGQLDRLNAAKCFKLLCLLCNGHVMLCYVVLCYVM